MSQTTRRRTWESSKLEPSRRSARIADHTRRFGHASSLPALLDHHVANLALSFAIKGKPQGRARSTSSRPGTEQIPPPQRPMWATCWAGGRRLPVGSPVLRSSPHQTGAAGLDPAAPTRGFRHRAVVRPATPQHPPVHHAHPGRRGTSTSPAARLAMPSLMRSPPDACNCRPMRPASRAPISPVTATTTKSHLSPASNATSSSDFDGILFADIWDPTSRGYWRTCAKHYVSDHRPLWVRLQLPNVA